MIPKQKMPRETCRGMKVGGNIRGKPMFFSPINRESSMDKSQRLYSRAKNIIPGGTQLLSKRPEMFLPDYWPAYYEKAKGCEIWDLDGKRYFDMSYMGIGSCLLGYCDEEVDSSVIEAVKRGNMTTLNVPEEVELAELLCELHPWAGMVRYARTGGEAMAVAVRIARAETGRDKVLFCGYHGWHDWYLSANLNDDNLLAGHLMPGLHPLGVPAALKGSSVPFTYNNAEEFIALVDRCKDDIGVVVLETIRNYYPEKEFFDAVRGVTADRGIVLILDEITSGFRLQAGGAHLKLGMEPDMAVFAKAMSNGFPMAAIIGKESVMESAQETFVSSTYWTDRIGPSAALASMKKMQRENVPDYIGPVGNRVQQGWRKAARENGLKVKVTGIPPLGSFMFEYDDSLVLKTLFTQEMLKKGFLATTAFYPSYAHTNVHVGNYLDAVNDVFSLIASAVGEGDPGKHLMGPVCHSGFKRLT